MYLLIFNIARDFFPICEKYLLPHRILCCTLQIRLQHREGNVEDTISKLDAMEEFIRRLANGDLFSAMSDKQWKRDVVLMATILLKVVDNE